MSTFQQHELVEHAERHAGDEGAGSDRMPTTTAAASAGSSTVGPGGGGRAATPSLGARSTTVSAARPPATDHSSSESRLTGMPSSRARSMFSAMPRTAMPASVRSRNHVSSGQHDGHDGQQQQVVAGERSRGRCRRSWSVSGVGTVGMTSGDARARSGRKMAMPPSSWARPMVADGQHEPGRVGEPADDEPLDERRRPRRRWRSRPAPACAQSSPCRRPGAAASAAAEAAHGAVGEVDDPGGAVGEHEPDGQQAGGRAEQGALEHDAQRAPCRGQAIVASARATTTPPTTSHAARFTGTPPGRPRGSRRRWYRVCRCRRRCPGLPLNGETASGSHQISRMSMTGV